MYLATGTMQVIIDERADEAQRKALATVLRGGETEEARTHWWVYRAMSTTVYDPIFKPIDFEVDIERRTARVSIPAKVDSASKRGRTTTWLPASNAPHDHTIGPL